MASDVEIERSLAALTATLNDHGLEEFDRARVQEIVTEALGGEELLFVDEGGGIHDRSGTRVGAIRKTPSGEWIADRQNDTAERSGTAIPARGPEESQGKLGSLLKKLPLGGS
jgi:hypothetical protein